MTSTTQLSPFRELRDSGHLAVVWLHDDLTHHSNSPSVFTGLWNRSRIRICVDGAANRLRPLVASALADLPHIVSGDFDSITAETLAYFEGKARIQKTEDQDETDLTKALMIVAEEAAFSQEINAVAVLGGLSGRFDHSLATLNSLHNFVRRHRKPIYVVDSVNLVTILAEGSTQLHLETSKLTGKCGILPLCQRETVVTTEGFRWCLRGQRLEYGGILSSSNELAAEEVRVDTTASVVFTLELRNPERLLD